MVGYAVLRAAVQSLVVFGNEFEKNWLCLTGGSTMVGVAKAIPVHLKGRFMWCHKILVAYDGSAPSHRALEVMREIAQSNPAAEVVLVHAMRLFSSGSAAAGMDTVMVEDAMAIRRELEAIAAELPNPAEVKVLKGTSPADLIVNCAKDEGCDLIIMGSRGQGGVKGFLGSVSYAVTKESPITVLIAKEGAYR